VGGSPSSWVSAETTRTSRKIPVHPSIDGGNTARVLDSVRTIARPLLNDSSPLPVDQVPATAGRPGSGRRRLSAPYARSLPPATPFPCPSAPARLLSPDLGSHRFISDGIDVNLLWPLLSLRPTHVAPPTRHLDWLLQLQNMTCSP
jgi:hypothetical protein